MRKQTFGKNQVKAPEQKAQKIIGDYTLTSTELGKG